MTKIIVKCPTYKEAFILRRALIELNVNWRCGSITDLKQWKKNWEDFKNNTIYFIRDKIVTYDNINTLNIQSKELIEWTIYDNVQQFIKKYISYIYEE